MKTTKEEFIKSLEVYKDSAYSTLNGNIANFRNMCYTYINENRESSRPEEILVNIVNEYALNEYVAARLNEFGALMVAKDLEGLRASDSNYYWIDPTYGDVKNIDSKKFNDIIDEMIDAIKN